MRIPLFPSFFFFSSVTQQYPTVYLLIYNAYLKLFLYLENR